MPGITRIHITDSFSGSGKWRLEQSRTTEPVADDLYRFIFDHIGMPIQAGEQIIECTRVEFMAGYDYELGIDVILKFMSDQTATLQEKFLNFDKHTLTVEYMQDTHKQIQGDWFKLKAQYYFCGYPNKDRSAFDEGVLVDWPRLQLATSQGRVRWHENVNTKDGARASFKYVEFDRIPSDVLIYRHSGPGSCPKCHKPRRVVSDSEFPGWARLLCGHGYIKENDAWLTSHPNAYVNS